jgi:predicted permease
MFAMLAGDLRSAFRHVSRRPLFATAVTATLALGITATTIAYGLSTSVLWRPLPFREPERLVFAWERSDRDGQRHPSRVTSGRFADWRDRSQSLTSLALFGAAGFSMDTPDGVTPVRGTRVSASFFETLGVSPALGRTFSVSDEIPGHHQVLILSHAFWQQRLGARADILETSIRMNGLPYTVVGVMPPIAFPGWPVNPATVTFDPTHREFWVPIARTPELDANTRSHVFGVVARLAPGVSAALASDELTRITGRDAHGGVVTAVREQFVRDARLPLLALLGAAAALLIVACTNLASLHVSSFESRRAELGVRAAIGASAGRLASQLTAESLLLAALAGGVSILVARVVLAALPNQLPPGLPFLTPVVLDRRVAGFAVLISMATGLTIAAWPVGRLLRSGPAPRGVTGRRRASLFRVLVIAQVSVTIALTVSAARLVQSLWAVRSEPAGFLIDGVVVTDVGLPRTFDRPARIVAFEDRVREAFESRAGVRAVAIAYDHPLEANWTDAFRLDGGPTGADAEILGQAQLRIVSANYFDALGVTVILGRTFTEDDGPDRAGVAVVNEAFAREQGGAVVGRRLRTAAPRLTWGPSAPQEFEILGVVKNERFRGLERPSEPAVYLSTRQFAQTGFTLLIRTSSDADIVARDVRAVVRAIEPAATVGDPSALAEILDDQLVARRVTADVIGGFAGAALALAALGVYGVLAMLVASRTREIGVRLALGATAGGVARRVLRDCLLNAGPGIAAGVVLATVAGRFLESFFFGVSSRDPFTLALGAATMLCAAVLAALVPAIRAARVDPAILLRGE